MADHRGIMSEGTKPGFRIIYRTYNLYELEQDTQFLLLIFLIYISNT